MLDEFHQQGFMLDEFHQQGKTEGSIKRSGLAPVYRQCDGRRPCFTNTDRSNREKLRTGREQICVRVYNTKQVTGL